MIEATAVDIQRMNNSGQQNAIVFNKYTGPDDFNNTRSLMAGIKNPNMGHIFAGIGIDHVKEIKPVNDIIQELVTDLGNIS
jgi:hypothetical protein